MKLGMNTNQMLGGMLVLTGALSGCAAEAAHHVEGVDIESGGAGAAAPEGEVASDLVEKSVGRSTEFYIHTGCVSGAGTSANVRLRYCQKINRADCGWRDTVIPTLRPPDGTFDRCDEDYFPAAFADPAWTVTWLELSHDNSGSGAPWYVDYVDVQVPLAVAGRSDYWWYVYRCTFNTWISSADGLRKSRACVQRTGFWGR